jgi:hypothetical protein
LTVCTKNTRGEWRCGIWLYEVRIAGVVCIPRDYRYADDGDHHRENSHGTDNPDSPLTPLLAGISLLTRRCGFFPTAFATLAHCFPSIGVKTCCSDL